MTLPASQSRSRALVAAFVGSVAVVVAALSAGSTSAQVPAAPAASAVTETAPKSAPEHCHDMGSPTTVAPDPAKQSVAAEPVAAELASLPAAAGVVEPEATAPLVPAPKLPPVSVSRDANPFIDRLPNLVVRTHEGRNVRFYDDLIKDKVVMINFMYSTCKGR